MLDSMIHRGPDAEGSKRLPGSSALLGHRRLSIMDPEGGNQPIYNEDHSMAVVANGEIYNFPRLYDDLSCNHNFNTRSDTESVLHLYEDNGADAVNELEGMFSIAITDGAELYLARDPLGIKPLYYAQEENGRFLFASELKALAGLTDDIKEFPPGSFYHSSGGFKKYYELPAALPVRRTVQDFTQRLRQTLEEVVASHLMSDVPLGVFLSGGLDSSIIAALARRLAGRPIHSFSVGVEGSSDLEAARLLSSRLDTIHHEYILTTEEVREKLPEIIYHLESYDQDLVRSAIPTYFTARLAQDYVKVVLSGEGADELFAGYTYYKDQHYSEDSLHQELCRSVSSLHNINLQRVDRLTMAHSIEGRVPFLDLAMVHLGLEIPTEYKLYGDPPIEKWILRKAVEDLLPDEIVWRKKEQFDEGSGTVELMDEVLLRVCDPSVDAQHRRKHPKVTLRSSEECFYHRLFLGVFDYPEPIEANVGRWAERPDS